MILPRLNSRLSWFAHGLLGSLLLQSVTAFAQSLNWDSLIDESGGIQSHFGVALGNPAFYKRNETQSFLLASNAKLFVAAALLKRLGPDYKIETDLKWSRLRGNDPSVIENLTLVGYGDPSWGMGELGEDTTSRLNSFAQTLKTLGVKKILGDISIVASDSRWNDLAYPPGWQNDDHTQCYGALAQAVNLNLNCATFVQTSANQGHWVEDGIDVPVSMEIKPASYTYLQVQATSIGSFKIYGYFRAGSAPQNFTLPIHRAASWVHFIFGQALKNQGIAWVPAQARGTHSPLTLVTRFYSPPLSLLLQAFLKNSIDTMGDAFFKILGANYGSAQESLMEAGKSEMSAYLSEELGPLAKEVALFDGSGISHEDTASPEALLSFLSQAKNEKTFPALWQALSIAGVDGTLSDRMRGTIAQGILRGKTGTLSQTSNLSGYVPQYAQEKIVDFAPFVVLSQLNSGDAWNARAAQDRVGVEMVKSLNPQGAGFFLSDFVFPFIPRHSGLDNPFTY